MDNCILSTGKILRLLGVKYTTKYVEDSILSHGDHPSLLCISDTLKSYNINTLAVKIDDDKLQKIPLPCIVQVHYKGIPLFYTLTECSNEKVVFYNDRNKIIKRSKEVFMSQWTGVSLLVEKNETSKEPNIEKKLLTRRIKYSSITIASIVLLAWGMLMIFNNNALSILPISLIFFLKIVGLIASGFLLWFEVDQHNPKLQSFCSGGRKVDCNAVLNSKYSYIFNTSISLSNIAFAYFLSSIVYIMINHFGYSSIGLLSILSFITVPVIVISIYYQAFIIKNWCKFCLLIQGTLLLEVVTGLLFKLYKQPTRVDHLLLYIALFLIPIGGWMYLKPLLHTAKESNLYKRNLAKIKNNKIVFKGLLSKTKKITNETKGLGINLENENAKYNVIKVCNPYCEPCAKANPILEELYRKGVINLQIIFTAKADENDPKSKPVRHLLAIDEKMDHKKTVKALDDWYGAKEKDYKTFARKYFMNGKLEEQWNKIKAMDEWCISENINYTPTIFINGHELPKEYSVSDLKEFLQ